MAEVDPSSLNPTDPDAPAQPPAVDPLKGRVLNGRFRILEPIGAGGMGKVYKAIQSPLDRLVAVKVLHPQYSTRDQGFVRRFVLEASLTSKLRHPNTVTVIDYGQTEDNVFYIAMEYLEGRTLADVLLKEGLVHWERALHIGQQVARSLREAHKFGIIHRDLKPANVMLLDEADNDQVKVLDFGLVKSFVPDESGALGPEGQKITQAGMLLGSPQYMAPEQARNHSDPRSDVYSFGVLLYEMMTGRPPFAGKDYIEVIVKHMKEPPPTFRMVRADLPIPPPVEGLVMRCLAKDAAARFQSMDEMLEEIRLITGGRTNVSGARPAPTGGYDVRSIAAPGPHSPSGTLLEATPTGSFPVDVSSDFPSAEPHTPSGPYPQQPGSGQYPQPGSGQYPQPGSGQYPQPGSGPYAQRPPSGSYPQPGSGAYAQPPGGYNQRPSSGPYPQPSGGYPIARPPSGAYPQPPGSGSGVYPQPTSGPHARPPSGSYPQPGSGQYPQPGSGAYPQQSGGYPAARPPSGSYPQPGAAQGPAAAGQAPFATESPLFASSGNDNKESSNGKSVVIVLLLLLLLGGGGAAWWFGFRQKPAAPDATAQLQATAPAQPKPQDKPVEQAAAPAAQPLPANPNAGKPVHFKVMTDPAGARVFMGARDLGITPLSFEMPAQADGTATAELVFIEDGYHPLAVTAGGSGDVVLSQRLQKKGGGSSSGGGSRSSSGSAGSPGGSSGAGSQVAAAGYNDRIDAPTMMVADPKASPKAEPIAGAGAPPSTVHVGNVVMPFGEGMSRPEQLSGSPISYSREAMQARVEGLMIAKCVITTTGHVENCRVLKSLPYMDKPVLESLQSRVFKPITYQGRPVAVDYVFDVRLVLPKR